MRSCAGLVALLVLLPFARPDGAPAPGEVRALWVVRTSLTTPGSIDAMVDAAKQGGFTTLLVQVRGRGDAYYRSEVEPRARALSAQPEDFDPLARVLARARASGLAVHAWVNANLVADTSDLPSSGRHLVRLHPDWLMVPRDLAVELSRVKPRDAGYVPRLAAWTRKQSASVEGLYVSPAADAAVEHLDAVVRDLVTRYAVDGVHLDYVRYPGTEFDYSAAALDAFRHDVNRDLSRGERKSLERDLKKTPFAYVDRYPDRWQSFRQSRLTRLVRRLRATVKARRPEAVLSAAVVPDDAVAAGSRGQDWPAWIREDLLDVVCPMVYTDEVGTFRDQVSRARGLAADAQVWAGIGAYRLSREQTLAHIAASRELQADGFVLFSYDSLVRSPRGFDYLARLADAAFAR